MQVVNAGCSLATGFNPGAGVRRSGANAQTHQSNLDDSERDYVLITNGMMNTDFSYCASHYPGDKSTATITTTAGSTWAQQ